VKNNIDINNSKSYATEANLDKALTKLGLDNFRGFDGGSPCRYLKVRNKEGRWTAIFCVTEFANIEGGYLGFAATHGFMSV